MDSGPKSDVDINKPASYRYDAILPSESVMLEELLKETEIQQLFESFYNLITIPIAIIDLNANVLLSSRWQRICTQFHRVHPTACERCIESDTQLALQLQEGKTYTIYTCRNGLTDCASPIVIEGKHIANLFIGQFLTKVPDEAWFRRQAGEFSFDIADYIAALHEVPVVEAERIPVILELLARMTRVITNLGIDRKRAVENQARQSIILNTIPQSVFWKDLHGRYLGCNASFARATGLATPDDIVGKTDFDLPWPRKEAEAYRSDDQAVISANKPRLHIVEPLQQADGTRIVVDTSKIPLVDAGNTPYAIVGIYEDITERQEGEEKLKKALEEWQTTFNSTTDLFFLIDTDYRITKVNKAVSSFLKLPAEKVVGRHCYELMHGTTYPLPECPLTKLRTSMRHEDSELNLKAQNIWVQVTVDPLLDGNGNLLGVVHIVRDITERKKAEERIHYLAYYDSLTGLPNRNLFIDRVNQGIARAEHASRFIAVLLMNIDRFKSINDAYGPELGDKVLKEVAGRLSTSIRKGDTVARLSDDEFGIALLDVADTEDIIRVLEKIVKDVSYPFKIDSDEIILTLSTGISVYPQDGINAGDLLKSSGLALTKAKEVGRKTYQFYTEDMNVTASEFVFMEKHIMNALQEKEFRLHYQPYWDMNTQELAGMEVLIRWQSKDRGLIPPAKFIPILEDTGMIIDVGEWILRESIRQVTEWRNRSYRLVPVSVNLSLVQFRQKDLADMVKDVIDTYGFHPSLLTLEITESAFMQDLEFTSSVMKTLKDMGCKVSIDDFGTGYSSLSYLKRFPIDNLKIDMSFIRELAVDPDSASIVTAIINMAHTLNLKTIAEGIETEEQWKFLRLLRCDMGQGYYLSKPLPVDEMEKLLIRQMAA
jgi:diguanylate cyclase (GGDEF)-like protein/PAS domain S-box-containing protein